MRRRAGQGFGTKAAARSDEPELLGTCYTGVLSLEGPAVIPWIARFLPPEDDAAIEAAMSIAGSHTLAAFEVLRATFSNARDPWFRSAVLAAVALTRQQEATDWLLRLIASGDRDAADAHQALCRSAPSADALERLDGSAGLVVKRDDIQGMRHGDILRQGTRALQ